MSRNRRAEAREQKALAEAIAAVLDDTLDDLRAEKDPRKAVIAAYARLERVLAAHGHARSPAEAPGEYLNRILPSLAVEPGSVQRLTDLFTRAKFSTHEVDAGMKEDAIDALSTARDELRAAEERRREEQRARARDGGRAAVRGDLYGAARILAVPTLVLATIVAFVPGRVDLAVRFYALVLCAVVLGYAVEGAASCVSPGDLAPRGEGRGATGRRPPSSLARLENEAALGVAGAFDLHHRLRPRLRSISAGLLAIRGRTSLDGDPETARSVLGETTWEVVRRDRPPPQDRLARGLPISDLRSVVESLERV